MKNKLLLLALVAGFTSYSQTFSGLVAHFNFNNNLTDLSPTGINGINHGAIPASGPSGQPNSAYYFDGSSYIDLSSNNRGITNRVTISYWVNTSQTNLGYCVGKYNYNQDRGYHSIINNGQAGTGGRDGSSTYRFSGYSGVVVNDGNWHHVVSVIDSNVWEIWVDCKLRNSFTTNALTPMLNTTDNLNVGRFMLENNHYFTGRIDEIQIYNRVLSLDEMYKLCDSFSTWMAPPTPTISFSPNPAKNLVTMTTSDAGQVIIVDNLGKIVYSEEVTGGVSRIDLSEWSPGIYFVNYNSENDRQTTKFVVQ